MTFTRSLIAAAIATTLAAAGSAALAQTSIDQNRALAGNITPGDSAGFPITLSQPGHYILRSNLLVPAGQSGIEITGPNVTLDLNGYSVIGPRTCTRNAATREVTCTAIPGAQAGIFSNADNAQVRRGTVQGFFTGAFIVGRSVVSDLVLTNNGTGLFLSPTSGKSARASGVLANFNASHGIQTEPGYILLESCMSDANGGSGFYHSGNGDVTLIDSTAQFNGGAGVDGGAGRGVRARGNATNFTGNFKSMGGNLSDNTAF